MCVCSVRMGILGKIFGICGRLLFGMLFLVLDTVELNYASDFDTSV